MQHSNFTIAANFKQFFRYCVTGGTSTAIDMILVYLLSANNFSPNYSISIGFFVGLLVNYQMHHYFTFSVAESLTATRFTRYMAVVVINYLITLCIANIVIFFHPGMLMLGKILSLPIVVLVGYFLTRKFVFNVQQ